MINKITLTVLFVLSFSLTQLSAQNDQLQVPPFCDIPLSDYLTLPDGYTVSTNNPNGITWTNQKIRVTANSVIHFDKSVVMNHCTVRMEQKAKIMVENGATLTTDAAVDKTIFFGCTDLWDGIEIGAGCSFILNHTEIRDAVRGLVPLYGNNSSTFLQANNCRIQNCTFNNNNTGITVDYSAPGLGDNGRLFLPSVFSGNTFMKNPATSLPGATLGGTGIKFISCSLALLPPNNLYTTPNGVTSNNSLVAIYGGTMTGVNQGVDAYNSNLYMKNVVFNSAASLVRADRSRYLNIEYCTSNDGLGRGVLSINNAVNRPQMSILHNNLYFRNQPLYAFDVERSPSINLTTMQNQISYNNITYANGNGTQNNGWLIHVNSLSGGPDQFPMILNFMFMSGQLTIDYPAHGIYITGNGSGYNVSTNFLNYNWTAKPTNSCPNLGISLVNVIGENNQVKNNTVNATLFSNPAGADGEGASWMKCSYHIAESPDIEICSNSTDHTYRAFHFVGDLGYCDFARNMMYNHLYGWHCAQAAGVTPLTDMDDQLWHENTWNGTCSKASAQHRDFPNGGVPFVIKVYPNMANQNPPAPVNPNNWVLSVNPLSGQGENSNCIAPGFVPNGGLHGWDKDVIDGTYPYASAAQAWDMQRKVLSKLIDHADYRPTGSAAQIWYDNSTTSSARKYADFEKLYYQSYQSTAAANASLDSVQKQYNTFLRDMISLDSLQNVDPNSEDTNLRQKQLAKASQFVTANTDLTNRQNQANAATQSALNTAATAWNNLPATSAWETNRKTLYGYWLQHAQGTAFTATDYTAMRSIAAQCPLQGGKAVQEISTLLPTEEAVLYAREDYWADCVQPRANNQPLQAGNDVLTVFPNPANQQVSLFLTQPEEASWTITDLTGRIWQKGTLEKEQNSVTCHTQDLPAGFYLATVYTRSGLTLSAKINVQH